MNPQRPEDRIIFPLDFSSEKEAMAYARMLSGSVGMFKIGLELFFRCGPAIVRSVSSLGPARVFLDLKIHDIPETASRAARALSDLDVSFATIHCGDSMAMLESAVAASRGKVRLLGVTLLTSISGKDLQEAGYGSMYCEDTGLLVLKRAAMAKTAGCAGVVCSGLEVRRIKKILGKRFIVVTPGIRPPWEALPKDDQVRIVTPARAIREGADYLVIGRPIRDAKDPKLAALRIAEKIREALESPGQP
ncbi:MAG: orotidine-5'-phosphate decarboxylase [Desulfobacterales bacterium CG23_combo_of_CG06-09_8_20_14_all_52_9]|nr:MAG: orotidine-5'-phosphate decarboxylase [Desulfobacterales bacterium CG23_combo_of_CG06-09_8_20_14_all_52_9]